MRSALLTVSLAVEPMRLGEARHHQGSHLRAPRPRLTVHELMDVTPLRAPRRDSIVRLVVFCLLF